MKKSKSSKRWLQEHFTDHFVKQAQASGYRSRAAYKLLEIQEKDKLLRPGMVVVDLGAAPGGWSQVAVKYVGNKGKIFAVDILSMDSIADVTVLQGDFTEEKVFQSLLDSLQGRSVDLVISDMAPNLSGIDSADQAKAIYLTELALLFAVRVLKPNGNFLVKIFQGEGFDEFLRELRKKFAKVYSRKPEASRSRSREMYLLAKGYKSGMDGEDGV